MDKKFKRVWIFLFILFIFGFNLFSAEFLLQKGNLIREDRYIDFEISTINNLQVVFKIVPDDWEFPKNVVEIVKENLYIVQNDKKIKIVDIKKFADYIMISFSRNELIIYENFSFQNNDNTLSYSIDEKYWPEHDKLKALYNESLDYSIDMDYINAFKTLEEFLVHDTNTDEFSFTAKAREKAEECINNYFDNKEVSLKTHKLKHSKEINKSTITEIDSTLAEIKLNYDLFKLYFDFSPQSDLPTYGTQIIKDYEDYLANLKLRYFNEVQEIFAENDYNIYKFRLMLDTLVRSLCYKDSLSFITSYDVATMDYLNFNQQLKQKIADLEWLNIFERLLKAVNLNIANEGYFLNTDCMENIKNLDMNAPQPYYNILQTLQCAFQENWTDFTININIAIQKCSDLELLKMLERMKISYIAKIHINVSDKVITEINSGINYLNIGNFEEAKNAFQKAKNWQSNFAFPDFMLGEVCVATGEFSRAEIYYDNAILKQQQYFEPIYAKLYLMLKNNDHESALQLLNSGFSANSWYSYFLLGRIYLMQNNNKKAKKYLELAANINSSNFDLLIFQGDVYKNLNDKKNAEMYYKKAGTLDPENDVFTSRLQELK